jgi:hypothetical protein
MLPNVIIFGGMRCGTTSVFRYLAAHPEVASPSKKELNVFDIMLSDPTEAVVAAYATWFDSKRCAGKQVRLEASPVYARNSGPISRKIRKLIPDVKIIFLLRQPEARILSIYKAVKRSNVFAEGVSFDRFITAMAKSPPDDSIVINKNEKSIVTELQNGLYSQNVQLLLEQFGADSVFIGFLETLSDDPSTFMRNLASFLGIDSHFYDSFEFSIENPNIDVRNPELYRVALLINEKLEPLLNRVPRLRKILRAFHYQLNHHKETRSPGSLQTIETLRLYYESDRSSLRECLSRIGIKELPAWLS